MVCVLKQYIRLRRLEILSHKDPTPPSGVPRLLLLLTLHREKAVPRRLLRPL